MAWVAIAFSVVGCSAPSEVVVVVGVAPSPSDWTDTVRITIDEGGSFETPLDGASLPLSLGVSSDGASEVHAVAEALRDGATVARQEGRMRFLPGRRLLLHLYLSPTCAGAACGDGRTCHLDGCIDVARAPCSFVALPDNGSDITCASPVGMDAGVVDASPGDDGGSDAGRDSGPDGGLDAGPPDDAGPVVCAVDEDCVAPEPCMVGTCMGTVCFFDRARPGTPCDDGLFCTEADACRDFGCGGAPVVCTSGRVCDEATGACVECASNMDCELPGAVSACMFPSPCATVGRRTSSIPYGTCVAGVCDGTVSTTIDTMETCSRPSTDGAHCGGSTELARRCCSGGCVNTSTDSSNCGGCGLSCGTGRACSVASGGATGRCACDNLTTCPLTQVCEGSSGCSCNGSSGACAAGQTCGGVSDASCLYP